MTRKRRRINPLRLAILIILVAAAIYIDRVVVPVTPPLFIPTPTATRAPAAYVADAEEFLKKGKVNQAIESYKQAVHSNPEDVSVYLALARLQIYTRDYKNALENAENALVISPNNSMAEATRGWALFFNDDNVKAEVALRSAIELDPNNALAHAFLAEVIGFQVANGDTRVGGMDEAISESRLALDLDSTSMETHRARGYVYEWTQNYDEAIREFEQAIAINKNIADLHMELGINYFNKGSKDGNPDLVIKATDEFNKAIPLIPTDPLPYIYLARTYANLGEYAKAWQFAADAVKNDPTNPYLHGYLGVYYRKDNQLDKAIPELRLAIRGGATADGTEVKGLPLSNDVRVLTYYWGYGLALSKQGECGEAIGIATLMRQAMPDDPTNLDNTQIMLDTCQPGSEGTLAPTTGSPASTKTPTPK
ncbi:MAG: tetratricopeptide repeat protein [Anaerolineaceae bacterium]|nr:tetratricopeptide repeat protein [Anaerolineaceae bacterium]